jgi:hypothetical protein
MFAKDDGTAGIDLDGCRNRETGEIAEWAMSLIRSLHSYTEISPSQEGVKIWVRAVLPAGRRKKPGLEIYDRGRYFTLTGRHLVGTPRTVESRQDEVEALIHKEFPESEQRARTAYDGPTGARLEVAEFLESGGVEVLRAIPDLTAEVVFAVVCPWRHEHTSGDTSGTRVGQYAGGALWFRCEHAHCAQRSWEEFREFVSPAPILRRGRVYARRKGVVRRD